MALLLITSLLCLTITLAYLYLKRRYSPSPHDPPGMKPQIFVGNLINSGILSGKKTFPEALIDFQRRYGDKFMFWFGSHPCIVFCRPEHAETILTDRQHFEQSPLTMPNFDLVCPHTLSLLRGAKWKRHVRIMLPMFKRTKMIAHLDTILQCADRFIDQNLHDGQVHRNLYSCCQTFTMNVIGFIGFDYDFDVDTDSPLKTAFEDFIFYGVILMMMPWAPRWLGKLYVKLNWKYQRAHRYIHEVSEKIIEEEQNKQHKMENQRPKNLIASFVSSLNEFATDEQISSGLTRAEMLDEVLVSILGGYGTTSSALAWFIFFLSKNPQVQRRMNEELFKHNLLMTDDAECAPPLTEEKLASLNYCECVTKEVFRLAPTVSLTTRMAISDITIDNVPIHSGQTVFIGLHNMHTDERYWHHADPKEFVPDRFLGKDQNYHPYAMVPFGAGHRACIGQDLAWLELKLLIIRMMQRGIVLEDTEKNTGGYEDRLACRPKNLAVRVRINRH